MANLALQPLEVSDFSGGMTDHFLQGGATRYQRADNFLINVDRKLEVCPGSVPFDSTNYKIPGPPRRIDRFILFNNESELFSQVGRDIFYLNPNWTRLLGTTGNEPIGAGGSFNQVSYSPWNSHLFFTSDDGPLPGKIYRDENNELQVRTAGLPAPKGIPTYTDSSLLTACIALANDLRRSIVDHINDLSLHSSRDKWSLSYFTAQTWFFFDIEFPGPTPTPTPAPAATDQTSLFNLVEALCLAYEHHGFDPENEFYHLSITYDNGGGGGTVPPKGPFRKLSNNTKPTKLEIAAAQLDELHQRWNWHRLSIWTHNAGNSFLVINKHALTQAKVGEINFEGFPIVSPNFNDAFRYVNYLKSAYNRHVTNDADFFGSYYHVQKIHSSHDSRVTIPDCTDLDSMCLLIFWIRMNYGFVHVFDSNWPQHTNFTMDTSTGSPNVTDVKIGGSPITLEVDDWVIATSDIFNDADPNNRRAARVVSSASGTATLSKSLTNTVGDQAAQYSNSFYHGSFQFGSLVNATNLRAGTDEFLEPNPTSGLENNTNFPSTIEGWIDWAAEIFNSLAIHMGNGAAHMQANSIENFLQGSGPFFKPQIASYAYAFLFKYEYKVQNGVEFLNLGPPIFIGPFETGVAFPIGTELEVGSENFFPFLHSVVTTEKTNLTNLPNLINTSETNYDTAKIKVQVYRTTDGGNTFFLMDEVSNGTSSFVDDVNDTIPNPGKEPLNTREVIYTTGGIVQNDPPPKAKFLHILNNTAYYVNVIDAGQSFPNRVVQAIPNSPDAAPPSFFDDLEDELTGVSSTRNNTIVFGKTSVYRLGGGFNNLGQGFLSHERISDSMGCLASNSIVQTEIGIFFAGNDGFYYTDGFQLIKVSIDLDETYRLLTLSDEQKKRISGVYDRITRRIWWSLQSHPTGEGCDVHFIYYLNYGVKPSGVFTTASNGSHYQPSATAFFKGQMIRGDERGLIFKHDSIYKTHPKVPSDLNTPLANWGTVHIPYDYRSCALDFGTTFQGQWATKVHVLGKNVGNVAAQVSSIRENNYSRNKALAPVHYRANPMWGQPQVVWGDSAYPWKYDGKLDQWRRFPAGSLRSQLRQIQISPAKVGVYRSDDWPDGATTNVNATLKTATLATPLGFAPLSWPLDVVDMFIAFSTDNYQNEFLITQVATNVITFSDTGNLSVSDAAASWVIRGITKEQRFSILSYAIHFSRLGDRGATYEGRETKGENRS